MWFVDDLHTSTENDKLFFPCTFKNVFRKFNEAFDGMDKKCSNEFGMDGINFPIMPIIVRVIIIIILSIIWWEICLLTSPSNVSAASIFFRFVRWEIVALHKLPKFDLANRRKQFQYREFLAFVQPALQLTTLLVIHYLFETNIRYEQQQESGRDKHENKNRRK